MAAEQGDMTAQYNLGSIYHLGQSVNASDEQSFKWYKKSAEQGFARAQYNVGNMYQYGTGTHKSLKEARKWYQKSANQGYPSGIEALRRLGNQ